jgi:hypothetical protein
MEGACDRAIYPDENIAITSCAMDGYLEEGVGSLLAAALLSSLHSFIHSCAVPLMCIPALMLQGDRCKLDIVSGCMDPGSDMFDPLATVDDGSCPLESDSEE